MVKLPEFKNQDQIQATNKLFRTLEERDRLIKLGRKLIQNLEARDKIN